jgi:hypothetical protein
MPPYSDLPQSDKPTDSPRTADLPLDELQRRAGGLARELGRQYQFDRRQWQVHWEDMKQTALLAFLEHGDRPLVFAYTCARNALKTYAWVHIRGLNGGWKSLAARHYTLVDTADSLDPSLLSELALNAMKGQAMDEAGDDNLAWRLPEGRRRDLVPRPVEWAVLRREASPPPIRPTCSASCSPFWSVTAASAGIRSRCTGGRSSWPCG